MNTRVYHQQKILTNLELIGMFFLFLLLLLLGFVIFAFVWTPLTGDLTWLACFAAFFVKTGFWFCFFLCLMRSSSEESKSIEENAIFLLVCFSLLVRWSKQEKKKDFFYYNFIFVLNPFSQSSQVLVKTTKKKQVFLDCEYS
jgi:hypothetical protein